MFNGINAFYKDKDNLPIILMCWFHLKFYIRKHKKLIPEYMYEKTMNVIDRMHTCKSVGELKKLVDANFKAQCLDSRFNEWQLFLTNSPIESYNGRIKGDFLTLYLPLKKWKYCLNLNL